MIPPPGDDLDLDTLVLQAVRWHVPDRTYKTCHYLYPHTLSTMVCACQRPELLRELLRVGASQGLSQALDQALWWYSDACVELLLKAGVTPSDSALAMVLKDGRWPLLLRLLEHGGNGEARFQGGATLLHIAARLHCREATAGLLSRGALVDVQDQGGRTPLMRACEHWSHATALKCQEVTLLLLEQGADPNARDYRGMTPLMLAARKATEEFLQLLCAAGADPALWNSPRSGVARSAGTMAL